jgi:hypothetical protein
MTALNVSKDNKNKIYDEKERKNNMKFILSTSEFKSAAEKILKLPSAENVRLSVKGKTCCLCAANSTQSVKIQISANSKANVDIALAGVTVHIGVGNVVGGHVDLALRDIQSGIGDIDACKRRTHMTALPFLGYPF